MLVSIPRQNQLKESKDIPKKPMLTELEVISEEEQLERVEKSPLKNFLKNPVIKENQFLFDIHNKLPLTFLDFIT